MIINNNTTSYPNTVTITTPNTVPSYGYYTDYTGTSAGTPLTTGVNPIWTINPSTTTTNNQLTVKGDAEFEGEITVKGKNLSDMFEKIEERLAILRPNEELEKRWEDLRALRNAYKELEAEIIEKEKVWDILKR
jgi:hypothetical protein